MNDDYLKGDERIDQLYSHNIKIIQSPSVFSFSLDAVMLADFATPKLAKSSLTVDLCAGNGAVGLFLSDKTHGHIIEVEIQERLSDMAARSVQLNDLSDRISVQNEDLKDAVVTIGKEKADTVTVNPPYFVDTDTSKKNPNEYLAIARHEIKTNLEQIITTSGELLKSGGKLFMVNRTDRLTELLDLLKNHHMAAKRIQFIYPKEESDANMMLVSAIKDGKQTGLKINPPITVMKDSDEYTAKVKEMLYGK